MDKENRVTTTGIITEIRTYTYGDDDTDYRVYVLYEAGSVIYKSRLNTYMSSFYEGKEIEIYYNRNNPSQIGMIDSFDIIMLSVFSGFGMLFCSIGLIGLYLPINKRKELKKLKENGEHIYAKYVETRLNTLYSVNGIHPYNIICEWDNPEDNKKYIFKSENIWQNPERVILERNIDMFPVYINRKNIKKYIVDIEKIEENVVDLT